MYIAWVSFHNESYLKACDRCIECDVEAEGLWTRVSFEVDVFSFIGTIPTKLSKIVVSLVRFNGLKPNINIGEHKSQNKAEKYEGWSEMWDNKNVYEKLSTQYTLK